MAVQKQLPPRHDTYRIMSTSVMPPNESKASWGSVMTLQTAGSFTKNPIEG
jgi:hypothetical protein